MKNAEQLLGALCAANGLPVREQYSLNEAARLMRCGPRAIINQANAGRLTVYGTERRRWLFADDIVQFLLMSRVVGADQEGDMQT